MSDPKSSMRLTSIFISCIQLWWTSVPPYKKRSKQDVPRQLWRPSLKKKRRIENLRTSASVQRNSSQNAWKNAEDS